MFLFLSVSVSLSFSASSSACLRLRLSDSLCLCLSLSLCLCLSLPLCLSVYLFIFPPTLCLSILVAVNADVTSSHLIFFVFLRLSPYALVLSHCYLYTLNPTNWSIYYSTNLTYCYNIIITLVCFRGILILVAVHIIFVDLNFFFSLSISVD